VSQYRRPGFNLDPAFSEQVRAFQERNRDYKVTFQVTGRWGPMMGYKDGNVTPAVLEAPDGDTLTVEDEADGWYILVG
jgi:hypothetical protein